MVVSDKSRTRAWKPVLLGAQPPFFAAFLLAELTDTFQMRRFNVSFMGGLAGTFGWPFPKSGISTP